MHSHNMKLHFTILLSGSTIDTRGSVTNSNQPGTSSGVGKFCDLVYVYISLVTMDVINNYVIMCLQ